MVAAALAEVVGRDEELAALDALLDAAAGGLDALLLEGEAGIGEIMPFEMGPQGSSASNRPNGVVAAEWMAMGSSTADCPGQPAVALDVSQDAVVAFRPDGVDDILGDWRLRGRAQGIMVWNGEPVNWDGQIRGTASCADPPGCQMQQLDMRVGGETADGDRLLLQQVGVLNLATGMLESLDVVQGFLLEISG